MLITAPSSIDPTGQRDVSAPLNAFLAKLGGGDTAVFPAGATYRCDAGLALVGKTFVTVQGNGAVILVQRPNPVPCVEVRGCMVVRVSGLRCKGENPLGGYQGGHVIELEGNHGIAVRQSAVVEIDSCSVENVFGDFCYVRADHVQAHGCDWYGAGRNAVSFVAGTDLTVEHCAMRDVSMNVIDLEPVTRSMHVTGFTFRNNQVGAHRLNFLSATGQGTVDDVAVYDNDLGATFMNGQVTSPSPTNRWRNFVVARNVSSVVNPNSVGKLMQFGHIDGVSVTDNVQRMKVAGDPIRTVDCTDVEESGNSW